MFRRRRPQTDFDAEIAAHLQLEIDRLRESGLSDEEAAAAARKTFGNVTATRERFYEAARPLFWDRLGQDVRFAVRLLIRAPLLTTAIVSTLALGIGVATAIFSLVNAVVLRPLPYEQPDRLVQLFENGRGLVPGEADWVSFANFRDWQRDNNVFEAMAAYRYELFTVTGATEPESMLGLRVTDRVFAVLQVPPLLGRAFLPGEDEPGRRRVAMISYALWQRQFAGDPDAVGRSITIDGEPHTLIGIMPASFHFPNKMPGETAGVIPIDLWVPVRPAPDIQDRGSRNYWGFARLRSGVGLEQARTAMTAIAGNLARQYPAPNKDIAVIVLPLRDYVAGTARLALFVLLGAVGLVLLLTCANIAGLLLSRADSRRHEIAMRQALGASQGRLVRQALTESLLLAFLGAGLGVGIAYVGVRLLVRAAPANLPRLEQTAVNGEVLAFCGVVAVCAGILFGLGPAVLGSRSSLLTRLQETGGRTSQDSTSRRVRQMLVAGQLALAVMLLIGAGLLVRSFVRVTNLELGFQPPRLLTAFVNLPVVRYADPERQAAFFTDAVRRIQAIPGVVSAAFSTTVPLTGVNDQGSVSIQGRPAYPGEIQPNGNRPRVTEDYFDAMGIHLLEGRLFDERDRRDSSPVAIVSELAARMYWPDGALGKRVVVEENDTNPTWREVVGVVTSTRHFGVEAPQKGEFYIPYAQSPSPFAQLVVRTAHDPALAIREIRRQIASIDPDQPVYGFQTMEELLTGSSARRRFETALVAVFATLALLLAAIGVYAVMSHRVAQRKREIGVRLALGARPVQIVALVLRNGMSLTLVGTAAGLAGAAVLSRVLTRLLYGVSPLDAPTYIGVTLILIVVAGIAAYVPSRSAGRVDPLITLREQ